MIDVADFKSILASFASGVGVVTACDRGGHPLGFTCSAICSVSAAPPLLLVCVDTQSETLPGIEDRRSFTVNLLRSGREALSQRFATKGPDKFDDVSWEPGSVTGTPVLSADTVAHAECEVTSTHLAGDHWILVAQVVGGAFHEDRAPLLHFRRQYLPWAEDVLSGACSRG